MKSYLLFLSMIIVFTICSMEEDYNKKFYYNDHIIKYKVVNTQSAFIYCFLLKAEDAFQNLDFAFLNDFEEQKRASIFKKLKERASIGLFEYPTFKVIVYQ